MTRREGSGYASLPNEHAWPIFHDAMRLHDVLDPYQPGLARAGPTRNTEPSWHGSARLGTARLAFTRTIEIEPARAVRLTSACLNGAYG